MHAIANWLGASSLPSLFIVSFNVWHLHIRCIFSVMSFRVQFVFGTFYDALRLSVNIVPVLIGQRSIYFFLTSWWLAFCDAVYLVVIPYLVLVFISLSLPVTKLLFWWQHSLFCIAIWIKLWYVGITALFH